MANENGPIKRSAQLTPLSKEHHEGLLFGWKIRQGLNNGTDINTIGEYVQWFWKTHLQEHFWQEEQLIAAYLPKDDTMLQRMLNEHQEIEAYIHINDSIIDAANLLQIADAVRDHIRFEEREFFPYVESKLSTDQLDNIYVELSKAEKPSVSWMNEFWIQKK